MAETKPTRTPAERARTDALGPTTRTGDDLPGITGREDIHGNAAGATHRDGEPPPASSKWYAGQGGVTGTRSGTPFATADPRQTRPPDEPPPVDWDPESTEKIEDLEPTRPSRR